MTQHRRNPPLHFSKRDRQALFAGIILSWFLLGVVFTIAAYYQQRAAEARALCRTMGYTSVEFIGGEWWCAKAKDEATVLKRAK